LRLRNTKQLLVLSGCLLIFTLSLVSSPLNGVDQLSASSEITTNSTYQEYRFAELAIFTETLEWEGIGTNQILINKTFDLNNNGPIMLVIDFTAIGHKPDSPGYIINGTFNQEAFDSIITRDMLSPYDYKEITNQIAIPINTEARIYGNTLEINVSCTNEHNAFDSGILTIEDNSRILVGNVLKLDSLGMYDIPIYPNVLIGWAGFTGIAFESFVQITIDNETLTEDTTCKIILELQCNEDVSVSLDLNDGINSPIAFSENETTEEIMVVIAEFSPKLGVNYYAVDTTIYGGELWAIEFNLTIANCYIVLEPGSGSGNLEIPFFQWPSIPFVGVLVLFLWIVPYSVLKYRAWKKLPDEVDMVSLDEDDDLNIFDPEGLSVDDDDDDIDDTYEIMDDD